ncbi:queuosine salvage family protein [Candidatus Wolfebacteria bacterium]|nr:queuosine salvage family protein [Candidatus Wolfebacteria bacterium]
MLQDVLPSTQKIVNSSEHVFIDDDAVEEFCKSFSSRNFESSGLGDTLQEWDIEKSISLVCLFNCVNFCFWTGGGEEKWRVTIRGEVFDGASGLFLALEDALRNDIPVLDANYLSEMTQEQLEEVLKGNIIIPLLDERVNCLHEGGKVLLEHFDGQLVNVFHAANGDAVELTNLLVRFFPSFDDHTTLDGVRVDFHKRAQLNTDMINYRLGKKSQRELTNHDKLTAFADYKVPQILRRFGILTYAPALAERIDSLVEIHAGSREEVEIRAATIWAVERMKQQLIPNNPDLTSARLDNYLWHAGQTKSPDDRPYHRTKTIYY